MVTVKIRKENAGASSTSVVMGVDPGLHGGVAIVQNAELLFVDIMPVIGKEIDIRQIREWGKAHHVTHFVTEQQRCAPGQGAPGTLRTGINYGMLLGMVKMLKRVPCIIYTPQKWQKEMLEGLPRGDKTKQSSAIAAARLWPNVNWKKSDHPSCKKPHDGKTDAALIAEYGRRHLV